VSVNLFGRPRVVWDDVAAKPVKVLLPVFLLTKGSLLFLTLRFPWDPRGSFPEWVC